MSTSLGQFAPFVSQATSLMAVVGALLLAWKKRAPWEPVEEDVPQGPQRVAGLVAAVLIGGLWWYQGSSQSDVRATLVTIAMACVTATVLAVLAYGLLITVYTYERVLGTGPSSTKRQKVIGGFFLTAAAATARKAGQVTIQELFQGAAYDADKVWTRPSRGLAKAAFSLAYMILIGCGTVALGAVGMALVPGESQTLEAATVKWIREAEQAKSASTIHPGSPLPPTLGSARSDFEEAWRSSALGQRKRMDPRELSKALSYLTGVYRVQERNEPTKANSVFWANEAIRFFEETQNRELLVEAMLDKAAVLLEISQLEHTSQEAFLRISREGDEVMTRAAGLAEPRKKAEVLRISSRFYYNLARPKSFRLSDKWDNNYLLLAHARAQEAVAAAPDDIKNANQLLRATMKAAKNPPQDTNVAWSKKLREAQRVMKAAWAKAGPTTNSPVARLSPLSVLGTGTLEAVAHAWRDTPASQRRAAAPEFAAELEADGLALLREAEALLKNGELRNSYGFDIYYDLARTYAQRVVMLRLVNAQRADREFAEVKANFSAAREGAKASQLDAARKDLDRDLSFSQLSAGEKAQLRDLLRNGSK